jgi:hypothetical protein
MHLLGFYTHVVFEALCAHLQIQYLICKVKGIFFSGLMIKKKQINFKEPQLDMFREKQS